MNQRVCIAYGDGIGPEILKGTVSVLEAAKVPLDYDVIEIGEKVYRAGFTSGIRDEDWDTLIKNQVLLKAPITTPQGSGYKSLNVTLRKTLGLFSNVRPVKSLAPYVKTKHPQIDMVIVRENEEDLYAGIEHRQTEEVVQCLKLISKPGSEKIIRYAFEYAVAMGRKKVSCMIKDNIMKLTDGMFHDIFKIVSKEYPQIESDSYIVDIGAALIANTPEDFDVVVVPNLYGDIISDIAAQIAGSVGLCGSANIGDVCAMFEAIHGSAPQIAGQNVANPSGILFAALAMLNHLGLHEASANIENALLKTIEDGIHTADIYSQSSSQKVGTDEFCKHVIGNLGNKPQHLSARENKGQSQKIQVQLKPTQPAKKQLEGVDVFICENNRNPNDLGNKLIEIAKGSNLNLIMITNRGVKVFPNGNPLTFCTDHWRCRFSPKNKESLTYADILNLMAIIDQSHLEIIKTENLYSFNGEKGYSLGQGQ